MRSAYASIKARAAVYCDGGAAFWCCGAGFPLRPLSFESGPFVLSRVVTCRLLCALTWNAGNAQFADARRIYSNKKQEQPQYRDGAFWLLQGWVPLLPPRATLEARPLRFRSRLLEWPTIGCVVDLGIPSSHRPTRASPRANAQSPGGGLPPGAPSCGRQEHVHLVFYF